MDIYGPLDKEVFQIQENEIDGRAYILSIIDRFSKLTAFVLIREISAFTITKTFLEEWLFKYPIPKKIITDNGTQFSSKIFAEVCKKFNIDHRMTLPYNPTGNSIVERIHRDLGVRLRLQRGHNIGHAIKKAAFIQNSTFNQSIGTTPFALVFGMNSFMQEFNPGQLNLETKEKIMKENNKRKN